MSLVTNMFSHIKRSRKEIKDISYKKDTIFRTKNIVFTKYVNTPMITQKIFFFSKKTKSVYPLAIYTFCDERYEQGVSFHYYYTVMLNSEDGEYNESYLIDPYTISHLGFFRSNYVDPATYNAFYCDEKVSFMEIVHNHIRNIVKIIK